MRLQVIAVGRLKDGPERALAARYAERFEEVSRRLGFRSLTINEIGESRAADAAARIAAEAGEIGALIPHPSVVIALDQRGKTLASEDLAKQLGRWRDDGAAAAVFLIGGPDGLSPDLRRTAGLTLAFGAATWPHQMVRVMLLEQLYRAATILAGHPYHRA